MAETNNDWLKNNQDEAIKTKEELNKLDNNAKSQLKNLENELILEIWAKIKDIKLKNQLEKFREFDSSRQLRDELRDEIFSIEKDWNLEDIKELEKIYPAMEEYYNLKETTAQSISILNEEILKEKLDEKISKDDLITWKFYANFKDFDKVINDSPISLKAWFIWAFEALATIAVFWKDILKWLYNSVKDMINIANWKAEYKWIKNI